MKSTSNNHSEALRIAISAGNLRICERLFEEGANLDLGFPSCTGCTPVVYALYHRQFDIAEYLIAKGATIDGRTCNQLMPPRYTALHFAASDGDLKVLQTLLERNPEALLCNCPIQPFHLAIANGHVECVELMIEHTRKLMLPRGVHEGGRRRSVSCNKAPLDEKALHHLMSTPVCIDGRDQNWCLSRNGQKIPSMYWGATPLHIAAYGGDVQMTRVLLENGASIDIVNRAHKTPIHYAALMGHASMIEYLLQSGANVNAVDSIGTSALHQATLSGSLSSVKALVEGGANMQMRDMYQDTPLHNAAESNSLEVFIYLLTIYTGKFLGRPNDFGVTALEFVFEYGAVDLVTFILNFAPPCDAYVPDQFNVLMAALYNSKMSVAHFRELLKRLPQDLLPRILNHQTRYGTPLKTACISAVPQIQIAMIEMLLDAGADLEVESGEHGTPLMAACAAGKLAVVKFLVSKGAKMSYIMDGVAFNVFHAANSQPAVMRWLLVGRYTEGPELLGGISNV